MERLQGIEAFVRVGQTQSFAEAARQLGVVKSVVSQRVAQLEEQVGMPLLVRHTRSVGLSEAGMAFFDDCVRVVEQAGELLVKMREASGQPRGVLRVHALTGFVLGHFGDLIGHFQSRYPDITVDLVVDDRVIDPVREGFDCSVQLFEPVSDQLVARKLFPWRGVFCAAPAYLAARPAPHAPAALQQHRLGLYSRYPQRDKWVFIRAGVAQAVQLKPDLRSNSVQMLRDWALAGHGISCLPTFIAGDDLLAGRLAPVLPGYAMTEFWLSAVHPVAQRGQLKLELFLQALQGSPRADPPWDRQLIERGLLLPPAPT